MRSMSIMISSRSGSRSRYRSGDDEGRTRPAREGIKGRRKGSILLSSWLYQCRKIIVDETTNRRERHHREQDVSTLSTTTRKMENIKKDVLLTDTIGFLENLPHFMMESFRNTIEDIFNADMVLLVLDSSDEMPELKRKLKTSKDILLPDIDPSNIIVVLNKTDLLKFGMKERIDTVKTEFPQSEIVLSSVVENYGLDVLRSKILEKFTYPRIELRGASIRRIPKPSVKSLRDIRRQLHRIRS